MKEPIHPRALARHTLNCALRDLLSGKTSLRVLEAGGGSRSHITALDEIPDARITVIDISQEQLDKNSFASEKILGDLQEYRYKPASYDCAVCYDVVEHLERPDLAIAMMSEGVKAGGLLIIGAPNPLSLKGLITKCTPHAFHVFVYRFIFGQKTAGQPGCPPFPTVMSKWVEPRNLVRLAKANNLEVAYHDIYDSDVLSPNSWIVRGAWDLTCKLLFLLTLFRWNPRLSDYHYIFVKKAGNATD
jgi:2-polyprenyl-3-methyl-5-hydroxy-6-metoxy-1,4-benzoquinol methylase